MIHEKMRSVPIFSEKECLPKTFFIDHCDHLVLFLSCPAFLSVSERVLCFVSVISGVCGPISFLLMQRQWLNLVVN